MMTQILLCRGGIGKFKYQLPPSLEGKRYYIPGDQGYEKEIADRLKKYTKIA